MKIVYGQDRKFVGYSAFDFHIHSRYSFDCTQEPKDIVRAALRKKLNGIAVTDHNTIRGALETKKICKNAVRVITGCELETELCDIIGLFLEHEIDPKLRTFDDVVAAIRAQGGFVIIPHPFKYRKKLPMNCYRKADAIELLNGRMTHAKNLESRLFYYRVRKELELCALGSSDAHFSFEVGSICTLLPEELADFEDAKTLLRALQNEHIIICGTETPKLMHCITAGIDFVKRWMMGMKRNVR